jgi:hypothetical protein
MKIFKKISGFFKSNNDLKNIAVATIENTFKDIATEQFIDKAKKALVSGVSEPVDNIVTNSVSVCYEWESKKVNVKVHFNVKFLNKVRRINVVLNIKDGEVERFEFLT